MALERKRAFFLTAVGFLLLACLWFFVDVAARRSSFCDSCHYMAPYVKQWKASTHAQVACVQCHPTQRRAMFAQLVKYATGTYNPRPKAYVPDSACSSASCHPDMGSAGPVPLDGASFPHAVHLQSEKRGIALHCASCHGFTHEAGHVSVDRRVCFLCHFKGQRAAEAVGACGGCHGAPSGMKAHGGFLFDMKEYAEAGVACGRCHISVHEGNGTVPQDRCYACHVSRVEEYGQTKMVHEIHVSRMRARCLECHEPIRHGNVKVASVLEVTCESCHAVSHGAVKEMYLGVGGKGAPDTPSRMFAAQIRCTGCHTRVETRGESTFLGGGHKTADPRACAACHDARYTPMVERWRNQGKELAAAARRMASKGAALAQTKRGDGEALSALRDLEFNARFLEEGRPVHNVEYAVRIAQGSASLLSKLQGSSEEALQLLPAFARGPFSYCIKSCHSFLARPEPYDYQGVDVPHAYHLRTVGLSCDTCHDEERHKALLLASPKDCAGCHHDGAQASCGRCHPRQQALYEGKLPPVLGLRVQPDKMAGTVGCSDCHDPTRSEPLANVAEACEGCHEGQGAKDLAAWQKELRDRRVEVRRKVEEVELTLSLLVRHRRAASSFDRRLKEIQGRLDYMDRARPVHNVRAALQFLDDADRDLKALFVEMTRGAAD